MFPLKRFVLAAFASAAFAAPAAAQTSFTWSTTGCFYTGGTVCTSNATTKQLGLGGSNWIQFNGVTGQSGISDLSGLLSPMALGNFTFNNAFSCSSVNQYLQPYCNINADWGDIDLPNGQKFALYIDFTAPDATGNSPDRFTTSLSGDIRRDDTGKLSWNFSPDGDLFTYDTNGRFKMWVNNSDNSFGNPENITGKLQCEVLEDTKSYKTSSYGGGGDDDDDDNGPTYVNGPCASTEVPGGGQGNGDPTVTPEPSTYALMAAGLAGLGFFSRRRRRNG